MHWDFYTLLSVLSGIVLIAASLAGPVVGTARGTAEFFSVGTFSFIRHLGCHADQRVLHVPVAPAAWPS